MPLKFECPLCMDTDRRQIKFGIRNPDDVDFVECECRIVASQATVLDQAGLPK